jgi:hypothetical protein
MEITKRIKLHRLGYTVEQEEGRQGQGRGEELLTLL